MPPVAVEPPTPLPYHLSTAVATVVVPAVANSVLELQRHLVVPASRKTSAQKQMEEYYINPKGPLFATAVIAGTNAVKLSSQLIPFANAVRIQKCSFAFRRRIVRHMIRPSGLPHQVVLRKRAAPPPNLPVPLNSDYSILYCFCTVATQDAKVGGLEVEALTGANVAAITMYDMLKGLPSAQEDGLMLGESLILAKRGGKSDFVKLLMSSPAAPSPPPSAPAPSSAPSVTVAPLEKVEEEEDVPSASPSEDVTTDAQSQRDSSHLTQVVPSASLSKVEEVPKEAAKAPQSEEVDGDDDDDDDSAVSHEVAPSFPAEPSIVKPKQPQSPIVKLSPNARTSLPAKAQPHTTSSPPGDAGAAWWQTSAQERKRQEHNPRRRYGEGRLAPIVLSPTKKSRSIVSPVEVKPEPEPKEAPAKTSNEPMEAESQPAKEHAQQPTLTRKKKKKTKQRLKKRRRHALAPSTVLEKTKTDGANSAAKDADGWPVPSSKKTEPKRKALNKAPSRREKAVVKEEAKEADSEEEVYSEVNHSEWDSLTTTVPDEEGNSEASGDAEEDSYDMPPPRERSSSKKRKA